MGISFEPLNQKGTYADVDFFNEHKKKAWAPRKKHWARYLIVVPRPMPAAPRRDLAVEASWLPAEFVCYSYLIVLPRPFPVAPFIVRRIYLIVVPGCCPRRRSLCVALT